MAANRRQAAQIILRATDDERAELRDAANAAGVTLQAWALMLLLREARKQRRTAGE